jgi:hypothetical protein
VVEILSNSAHLHILLNHVPTVGFGLGLAMFVVAFFADSDVLKRTALVVFFVIANVTIATYVTGNAAESILRGTAADPAFPPGVDGGAIRAHEDAALVAFVFMEFTGFFAWLALWQRRRVSHLAGWNTLVVLVLAIVTFGLMARAAEKGGYINHPEIASEGQSALQASQSADTGIARTLGLFVNGSSGQTWVWAACETLHFIGLCLLFTVVVIVNMRMLGMIRGASFAAVYQLLPIGMLGFGINLITGMLFFIAAPSQYVHNITFYWKIVFVVIGGLNVLYFMLVDEAWRVGPGDDAPVTAKLAAASAIVVWVAVLFCGHMLPFIGNAF